MPGIYSTPRVPPATVSRARLTAELSTDAPLVVVRAPAGSGKTIAVADWASGLGGEASGVWFTVDEGSASRVAFWQSLLQVMDDARLLPRGGVLASSFTSLDGAPDLRRVLLRGFAQLPNQFVLIVDDLHTVTDAEVRQDLISLVEAIPRLRLIVITRIRSDLDLKSVSIRLGSLTLETTQLMFTQAETAELVEKLGFPDVGSEFSRALHTAVGGLPLTTRGILVLMQRQEFDLDSGSVQQRLEVAGAEVLRDVWALQVGDDRDVDFVIRCSVPEVLTAELATTLTGREDARAVLDIAESVGVGLWTDGVDGWTFSFTTAVRAELRRELDRRFPSEVRRLVTATAEWCLVRNQNFAALRYAIEIEDYGLAARAIVGDHVAILRAHRDETVEMLGGLPLRVLRRNPLVTMILAMALNATGVHRARAIEMFGLAVVSARMMGDKVDPVQRAVLLTIENSALRVIGQVGLSLAAAERTAAHYDSLTLAQKDQLSHLAPTLLAHTGLSFFYSGQTDKALDHFQASYALPRRGAGAGRLHALSLSAGAHALNGDMPDALSLVEVGREEQWPVGTREGYVGALFQVAEGMLALEQGDFDGALGRVNVMARHLETIEHWPLFMHLQSLAMLGMGRALEAATVLGEAMKRGARPSVTTQTTIRLDAMRALLLTAAGQLRSAENVLKRHPKNSPPIALGWARLHLTMGQPESARQGLQPMENEPMSVRHKTEHLLLQAACALRLGETDFALDGLDRAVALLDDRRLRMPLRLVPAVDRLALAAAAAESGRHYAVLEDPEEESMLLVAARPAVQLTEREHIVLRALVTSSSTSEIAASLFVSVNTVKSQLRSLYRKLGVSSRDEALRRAGDQGLLHG